MFVGGVLWGCVVPVPIFTPLVVLVRVLVVWLNLLEYWVMSRALLVALLLKSLMVLNLPAGAVRLEVVNLVIVIRIVSKLMC